MRMRLREYSPAVTTAVIAPAAQQAGHLSMKQIIFASVLSALIVRGITNWLEGGSK